MKAIALFSGGFDSMLAVKLAEDHGIEVKAVSFVTPFFGNEEKLREAADANDIDIEVFDASEDYKEVLKNPRRGFGKNANPCIDCRMLMLRKAKEIMQKENADLIITGEVLGQRPMSQQKERFLYMEKHLGLKGKILRPLSAGILPPVDADVDTSSFPSIEGRSRKYHEEYTERYGINSSFAPGGNCLLTEPRFAPKVFDMLRYKRDFSVRDMKLLSIGRHFRKGGEKIIVGRNKEDNEALEEMRKHETLIKPVDEKGPTALLDGKDRETAASLIRYYAKDTGADIKDDQGKISTRQLSDEEVDDMLITVRN
ncbi:MAG: tRNA 4-thiouridine(8) synthase ThiI [Nanobdellota archaeon]